MISGTAATPVAPRSLDSFVLKSDALRAFVLLHYGGVYLVGGSLALGCWRAYS